jgi:hypothetical protein
LQHEATTAKISYEDNNGGTAKTAIHATRKGAQNPKKQNDAGKMLSPIEETGKTHT